MSDVDGLYYDVSGEGPTLVLVPGAKGSADVYGPLARELARSFRVVTYDRRGFSRSAAAAVPDDARRMAADTEDLRALILHLGGGPASVFGNSSGAVVALELLARYPTLVTTVVAHEPPLVRLLDDAQTWLELFDSVYETYRGAGIPAAMRAFAGGTFSDADRRAMHRQMTRPDPGAHSDADTKFWLEHELRVYPRILIDLDALREHADRLVVAVGRESSGFPTHRAGLALAEQLGSTPVELPGGHVGCVTEPAAFAEELRHLLPHDKAPERAAAS